MNMTPAIRKAVAFITTQIQSGVFRPGESLPHRTDLARLAGLSERTMSSAIARLKADNTLEGRNGQRVRVPCRGRTDDTCEVTTRRGYLGVADRVRDDIVNGLFAPGQALPQIKELQRRYGVSYRTVIKALTVTLQDRLIVTRGRGYAVPSRASTAGASIRILFLWASWQLLPSRKADQALILALDQECLRNGVHLDCATVSPSPHGVVVTRHGDPRPLFSRVPRNCGGIIYLVNWAGSIDERIFSWLVHSERPLSIIDWLGGWKAPRSLQQRRQVQWFRSRINRNSGFQVGRYLAGLGHQRIAFFSPYTDPRAEELGDGLLQAAALAGPSNAVTDFTQKERLTDEEFKCLVDTRFDKIRPLVDKARPGIPPGYLSAHLRLGRSTWDICEDATLYALLEPSFEKAREDKTITAWVGSNDTVALMAWSYLRTHGCKIPSDISLVGFDNTFDALQNDITSYDFALPAIAGAALNFLLRPSWRSRVGMLSRPQIEGTIIQRGSTARA